MLVTSISLRQRTLISTITNCVHIHVSEKCGLQCGNHGKADKACSKCVCKQPWIGERCGMYV